jgi:hypothetical protein
LSATINGILNKGQSSLSSYALAVPPSDLAAFVGVHKPGELPTSINSILRKGQKDLGSFVDTHSPSDINAYIAVHKAGDLPSSIDVLKRKGQSSLPGLVYVHAPASLTAYIGTHRAAQLGSSIQPHVYMSSVLAGFLHGWQVNNLPSSIETHIWKDLNARISGGGKGIVDLPSSLIGQKRKGYNYLSSNIDIHLARDLSLSITGTKTGVSFLPADVHGWKDAYLQGSIYRHFPENVAASIRGWGKSTGKLGAAVRAWYRGLSSSFTAKIDTHLPKDLNGEIKTHVPGNLPSYVGTHSPGQLWVILRTWHLRQPHDLPSYVYGWVRSDMSAYAGGVPPADLPLYLRVWHRKITNNLPAVLHGWQQSPFLPAEIKTHKPVDLSLIMRGWTRSVPNDLLSSLHGYVQRDLSAFLWAHPYAIVSASIRSWHRNLQFDLPSSLHVWHKGDLSTSMGGHMWAVLRATVLPHPPPPLHATIRGWVRNQQKDLPSYVRGWQQGNLSASSGGHKPGELNVILKGVHRGAQGNLPLTLHSWQVLNITSTISTHPAANLGILLKGIAIGVKRTIKGSIRGWQTSDLGVSFKGLHFPENLSGYLAVLQTTGRKLQASLHGWQQLNLLARIDRHLPGNMAASIRPWHRKQYRDILAEIHGWQQLDLPAIIGTHAAGNLNVIIKVGAHNQRIFPANIHGWEIRSLGMSLVGTHDPVDIGAQLFAQQRRTSSIIAKLHGWAASGLTAYTNIVEFRNLMSSLTSVGPRDLPAYLRIVPQSILSASTYGWGADILSASVHQIWQKFLPAGINPITNNIKNLKARIKGYGSKFSDLSAYTKGFAYQDLNAILFVKYLADLPTYVFPIVPVPLKGKIHGWEEAYLNATLIGKDYPWNLTASIVARGGWKNLSGYIYSVKGKGHSRNLTMSVHPWETRSLTSFIVAANASALSAYLNPLGMSGDLHASIKPKMIRLTTIVKIPTLTNRDLSAIINSSCVYNTYRDLTSSIWAKYKGDLVAYITPIHYVYKPVLLGAKTGYTDTILEVDKFKIGINILPSKYFNEDIYKIKIKLLSAGNFLSSYIRGTLRYRGMSADVVCVPLSTYGFDSALKNRETFIQTTYDGVFKSSEAIEMAFKSAVSEYYYSTAGNYAWKSDIFSRWMLDVRSILPPNTALKLIRRLHRATTLYDLSKFKSVDAAMRYAISYVIEYPQSNLSASIYNRGKYEQLAGSINPTYTHSANNSLNSSISAMGSTAIIGNKTGVSKI